VIFFQLDKKGNMFIIDLIERSRVGIKEIADSIAKKGFTIQCHFLPHDAGSGSAQTGKSYKATLAENGVTNTVVLKRGSNTVTILNWLRNRFNDLVISDKLDRVIECLTNMEYEWSEKAQKWSEKPSHKGGFTDVVYALIYASQAATDYIGDDGKFSATTPVFAGMNVWQANPKVIELLAGKGVLLAHEKIRHSYPHCWRHRTPIIFRATTQWFVRMDGEGQNTLRRTALRAIEDTQFYPAWGKARLHAMIAGRPD
jgi:hypothetical protein